MAGPTANDSKNLQPWSIATTTSMTALALLAVCLRLLARRMKKQKLWWDDYMILFSMAWNFVVVGFIYGMIHYGMGIHVTEVVPQTNVVMLAKFLLVAEILYVYNLVWTKLSVLLMYYRIFRFPFFKRWAYFIGSFVVAWVICITFLFIFICVPVQKIWYTDLPGHCINQVGTWIANAASTIATDVAILVLPMPQVWKLHLSKPEKIGITLAFSLGFFVVFTSAYRFSVLFSYDSLDPSYTLAPTVGWTEIEMSAGIVSACLPTLLPVLSFVTTKLGLPKLTGGRSPFSNSKHGSRPTGTNNSTDLKSGHRNKNSFYALPDEVEPGMHDKQRPLDANLRPDQGYVYTVSSVPGGQGESDSLSGDEVPLHRIRVQKDFTKIDN